MYTIQDLDNLANHPAYNAGFKARINHIKNKDLTQLDPLLRQSHINTEYLELKSRMDNIERYKKDNEYILSTATNEVLNNNKQTKKYDMPAAVFIVPKDQA
jgi:hypothetical protein